MMLAVGHHESCDTCCSTSFRRLPGVVTTGGEYSLQVWEQMTKAGTIVGDMGLKEQELIELIMLQGSMAVSKQMGLAMGAVHVSPPLK